MKLYFGYHQSQPASLIGELPLMLALFASACGFFWTESYFKLLPETPLLSILPWLFAFWLSGFSIHWRPHRSYSSSFTAARTRDRLNKIYGWSAAIAAGYLSYRGLSGSLASLLNGGALESIVTPCAFFAALLIALPLGGLLHSLPDKLHNARLVGRLEAEPARETLTLAGGWLAVILLLISYQSLIVQVTSLPSYLTVSPENLCRLLLSSLAGTAAFAGLRCWLTPVVPLIVNLRWPQAGQPMLNLSRDTSIAPTYWLVFDRPLSRKTDGPLIDRIVSSFGNVPVVLVAQPGGDLFGEHLYLADRLGRMKALFPRLEIELGDWKRQLPSVEYWAALEYRELYPVDGLLVEAVTTLRDTQDQVVLVSGGNLERWRGLLPNATTRVLVRNANSKEIPARIAGYRTITNQPANENQNNNYTPGKLSLFLAALAGYDLRLLPNYAGIWINREHQKLVRIGIFISSLFGFFSAFYFFSSYFQDIRYCLLASVIFALLLLSINSVVAATLSKTNIFGLFTRIVISLCVGIIISEPLVLNMFHETINAHIETKLGVMKLIEKNKLNVDLDTSKNNLIDIDDKLQSFRRNLDNFYSDHNIDNLHYLEVDKQRKELEVERKVKRNDIENKLKIMNIEEREGLGDFAKSKRQCR